jgi:hypothetical protein
MGLGEQATSRPVLAERWIDGDDRDRMDTKRSRTPIGEAAGDGWPVGDVARHSDANDRESAG